MDTMQNWVRDRVFENDDYVVVVNKIPLRRPKFSISIGVRRGERLQNFIPVQVMGCGLGKPEVKPFADIFYQMLIEAQSYIQSESQRIEDEEIQAKIDREARQMDKSKPKPVVGLSGGFGSGKTAKRREAKRRAQAQNQS